MLVELAAKAKPGVDVLFLDTGYHFAETIGTRDAVEAVYGVNIVNARPEHSVAELYGVWGERSFLGKKYMGVARSTFVIGADGNVKKIFESVKPATHADDVLAVLAS